MADDLTQLVGAIGSVGVFVIAFAVAYWKYGPATKHVENRERLDEIRTDTKAIRLQLTSVDGRLIAMETWQQAHERLDDERYIGTKEKLGTLEKEVSRAREHIHDYLHGLPRTKLEDYIAGRGREEERK